MKEQKDIVIVDWGGRIPTDSEEEYLAHLLCLGGTCRYRFNERDFELHAGDLSIIRKRKLIERIEPSDDFRCKIIYVTPGFVELCTPQSNYGMKGQLALFLNPVMRLSPEQQIVCRRDFDLLEQRITDTEHRFYREPLITAMQAAILDFFDFHARIYGESDISTQNASIMNRFLKMLEEGSSVNIGKCPIMPTVCASRRNICRRCRKRSADMPQTIGSTVTRFSIFRGCCATNR